MENLPITQLNSLQISNPVGNSGQGGLYVAQMTLTQRDALMQVQDGTIICLITPIADPVEGPKFTSVLQVYLTTGDPAVSGWATLAPIPANAKILTLPNDVFIPENAGRIIQINDQGTGIVLSEVEIV